MIQTLPDWRHMCRRSRALMGQFHRFELPVANVCVCPDMTSHDISSPTVLEKGTGRSCSLDALSKVPNRTHVDCIALTAFLTAASGNHAHRGDRLCSLLPLAVFLAAVITRATSPKNSKYFYGGTSPDSVETESQCSEILARPFIRLSCWNRIFVRLCDYL